MRHRLYLFAVLCCELPLIPLAAAQQGGSTGAEALFETLPLRQSQLSRGFTAETQPLSPRDAARDDRWIGLGVSSVRWALDSSAVYFRWNSNPKVAESPDEDPWFRTDQNGRNTQIIPPDQRNMIPPTNPSWSPDGRRAAWVITGVVYLYDADLHGSGQIRAVVSQDRPARNAEMSRDGSAVQFMVGEDLYVYELAGGKLRQLTRKFQFPASGESKAADFLRQRQLEITDQIRMERAQREAMEARELSAAGTRIQPIPVPVGFTVSRVRPSPDGRFLTFVARRETAQLPRAKFMDYLTESGIAEVIEAGPRVGEQLTETRLGIVRADLQTMTAGTEVRWVDLGAARERELFYFLPSWSLDGKRAVIEVISGDHKDQWIAELDIETGNTRVLAHDHDDAFLGGPPIQCDRFRPSLLEWLPDGQIAFASERSGWSHLYLIGRDGSIRALTSGEWEVRDAVLSRDRSTWLLTASKEHPCEDHLYHMAATGGPLVRLTAKSGRNAGLLSPDGRRLAVIASDSAHLPDLFLQDPLPNKEALQITVSGTDAFFSHPLKPPETVRFAHPDGGPVWAALYKPQHPNNAALIHVHGGGDRQFSHRGWSVYGYASHIGLIQYFVEQGYTVLDLDYRGSSGFGRAYRTDIYRSAGIKDVDGAVAAVEFLVEKHGVDRTRVGIYGLSYGGSLTLMALCRYPGVFAAGIDFAGTADYAQSTHAWTVRVLNLPDRDPDAYRVSSPIQHLGTLQDPLLIVQGLRDNNVLFQQAVLLVQRLIELEKSFDVMFYPAEGHGISTEKSRYDYVRRAVAFFEKNLLRR
jgi:dipeptidyl aminopeptidase/acylaminoacyl peptidase